MNSLDIKKPSPWISKCSRKELEMMATRMDADIYECGERIQDMIFLANKNKMKKLDLVKAIHDIDTILGKWY